MSNTLNAVRPSRWRPQTQLVHGGQTRSPFGETAEALYLTSGFVYDRAETAQARFTGEADGYTYSRYENPTVTMFEERMALLEGAETGLAAATGMAAITAALMCQVRAGDHVVAARALFGSCRYIVETLLPRYGVESTLVDGGDLDAWTRAIRPNTKVFFFESPTNPALDIIDIENVCAIARTHNIRTVVDNVFATPVLQRPMAFGADVVAYSATKHIDGQGRCLGGIVLCSKDFLLDHLRDFVRNTGPSLSPFNAWVMLKGLETLDLRVERHCRNAAEIADRLAGHPSVRRVLYPGRADHPRHDLAARQMSAGGSLIAFDVDGGTAEAFAVANALKLIGISNNLGDAKSLITHPATTTHWRLHPAERAALGIGEGMLRLSVGLEDPADLWADLDQALGILKKKRL